MSDIGSFFIPYHKISVPNPTPFFPRIKKNGPSIVVNFNQGYVIDLGPKIPSIVAVQDCDIDWNVSSGIKKFYVKVVYKTDEEIAANPTDFRTVKEAKMQEIPDGSGEALPDTDKIYLVCEIENKSLKKLVLRENIVTGGQSFWCINEKGEPQKYFFDAFKKQEPA